MAPTSKIQAKFLGFKDGKVQLEKSDGSLIAVSMTLLSDEDQRWVREELRKSR